ncbi:MAG TPA: CocE/NonD family hydrolase [Solirubrobacterales bacterium]
MRKRVAALSALTLVALAASPTGAVAADGPLGLADCGPAEGVYVCSGLVGTWDEVPLDTTVTLPSAPAGRPLPLVVLVHGFGNSKYEYLNPKETAYTANAYAWARRGYAVLTFTARGLWGSCGTPDARLANPAACASGYIHLADVRYEVRDIQQLIGLLVDDGTADPRRIGVTGDSYGGGQSLMLAALRDRVMLPDGSLVPWLSPAGTPLRIAAAAPVIPWSDLVSAAAPNGRVSATGITNVAKATSPVGVEKATFVNAIFAAAQFATGPGQPSGEPFIPGRPMGFLAPPGLDPEADVAEWVARTSAGEPYDDAVAQGIVALLIRYHSAYYVPTGRKGPSPLLLASGFTDDLFPADESLRFANRTRKKFPEVPTSVLLGDFGHQRASNKPNERRRLIRMIRAWMDHNLRGARRAPAEGVTAYVQSCPRSKRSRRPMQATSFAALSRGAMRIAANEPQTISSSGGDPAVGLKIDPVTGGGDACVVVDAAQAPGTAVVTKTIRPGHAATLIGAPRIRATLEISGAEPSSSQVAARLWDVAPGGETQLLVARGSFRPKRQGPDVWQLHPAAWRFRPGHTIKLELLGNDLPYARASNGSFSTRIENLRLRLPLRARR